MALFGLLLLLVIIVIGAVYFAKHRDPADRARFLRLAAFRLMAFAAAVFAIFVIGETISDPGGWAAAGLIALWLIPLGALGALGWFRPDVAVALFAGLTVAVVAIAAWAAADSQAWRSFEDHNGPIRTIAVFVLTAVIALLGLKRPLAAGVLLVVLGIVPLVVSRLGDLTTGSLGIATTPGLVAGVLYLLAAALDQSPPLRGGRPRLAHPARG